MTVLELYLDLAKNLGPEAALTDLRETLRRVETSPPVVNPEDLKDLRSLSSKIGGLTSFRRAVDWDREGAEEWSKLPPQNRKESAEQVWLMARLS